MGHLRHLLLDLTLCGRPLRGAGLPLLVVRSVVRPVYGLVVIMRVVRRVPVVRGLVLRVLPVERA
jgi:hypothetical protein